MFFRAMLLAQARAQATNPKRQPPPPIPAPDKPAHDGPIASATPGPAPASPVSDPIEWRAPRPAASGGRVDPLTRQLARAIGRRYAEQRDDPWRAPSSVHALPHLLICAGEVPALYVRQPGSAWKPWDAGWSVSPQGALADIAARASSHGITVTRGPVEEAVRLPDSLDTVKAPTRPTILLLAGGPHWPRDAVGVLLEKDEAEWVGPADVAAMVRMAITGPVPGNRTIAAAYPELWSRPGWRWPAIEREAA